MKAESGENRITGRKRRVISIGFLILLVLIWELLSALIARPFLLPSPSAVFQSLWEHREEIFLTHLPATFGVVLAGGLLAVLLGAAFAVAMDWSPWLMRALYPLLTVTQTIPVMRLAPVLVLWFGYTFRMRAVYPNQRTSTGARHMTGIGYTFRMRAVVVILVNFFTVTVDLCDGFASTRQERT
ncbi:MAG: hypothetical protein IIY96_01840, partial [Lachnospiraceae bacterium]|nr:hypothetical protein [Lachnospiraceae bacterium]